MAARGIRKKRLVSAGSDSILFSWKSAAPPRTDHRGTGQYLFVLGCLQVVLGLYRSKNLRAMGRVSVRCSGTFQASTKAAHRQRTNFRDNRDNQDSSDFRTSLATRAGCGYVW